MQKAKKKAVAGKKPAMKKKATARKKAAPKKKTTAKKKAVARKKTAPKKKTTVKKKKAAPRKKALTSATKAKARKSPSKLIMPLMAVGPGSTPVWPPVKPNPSFSKAGISKGTAEKIKELLVKLGFDENSISE